MVLSVPWEYSFGIIGLNSVEKLGINPMGVSDFWACYHVIFSLRPVKQLLGINPIGRSASWADTFAIISLNPVNNNF